MLKRIDKLMFSFSKNSPPQDNSRFYDNTPLSNIKHDELKRETLVDFFFNNCTKQKVNLKFSLIGSRGSGRTTLLNFIENDIKQNSPDITLVRINCHSLNSEENVLQDILLKIGKASHCEYSTYHKRKNIIDKTVENLFFANVTSGRQKSEDQRFLNSNDKFTVNNYLNSMSNKLSNTQLVLLLDDLDNLDDRLKSCVLDSLVRLHKKFSYVVSIATLDSASNSMPLAGVYENFIAAGYLEIPLVTGNNKEQLNSFIVAVIQNADIVLTQQWVDLIRETYKENINDIKRFINNILVFPELEDQNKPSDNKYFSFLNRRRRAVSSTRYMDHYCRVASILLLKEIHPSYYSSLLQEQDFPMRFLDRIHTANSTNTTNDHDVDYFLREHFRYDGQGYSIPFFRPEDAKDYLTLSFRARPLSPIEEYLNKWFSTRDIIFTKNLRALNLTTADQIIEQLLTDNVRLPRDSRLNDVEIFHVLYWTAKALYEQFQDLMNRPNILDPNIKSNSHLLLELNFALEIAENITRKFLDRNHSGNKQTISLFDYDSVPVNTNKHTKHQLLFLTNLFTHLSIEIKLCQNQFSTAELSITKYRDTIKTLNAPQTFYTDAIHKLDVLAEQLENKREHAVFHQKNIEFDLFISHRVSELGTTAADQLYNKLNKKSNLSHKHSIYFHPEVVRGADNWKDELHSTIIQKTRAFLLILDDDYMSFRSNRTNWTHAEAVAARAMHYRYNCPIFWCYFTKNPETTADNSKLFKEHFQWLAEFQSLHDTKEQRFLLPSSHQKNFSEYQYQSDEMNHYTTHMARKIAQKLNLPAKDISQH